MNPDAPLTPREELEIRITALLMGQLPPEEAAEILRQIAGDPELITLHARLRHAVELLREARALHEHPAPEVPLQLSKERRAELLARFRGLKAMPPLKSVPTPRALPSPRTILAPQQKKKRDWKWVLPMGIAASVTIIGGGFLLSSVVAPRYSVVNEAPDFAAEAGDAVASMDVAVPSQEMPTPDPAPITASRFRVADNRRDPSAPADAPEQNALSKAWASQPGKISTFEESSPAPTKHYSVNATNGATPAPTESTTKLARGGNLYLPKATADAAPTSGPAGASATPYFRGGAEHETEGAVAAPGFERAWKSDDQPRTSGPAAVHEFAAQERPVIQLFASTDTNSEAEVLASKNASEGKPADNRRYALAAPPPPSMPAPVDAMQREKKLEDSVAPSPTLFRSLATGTFALSPGTPEPAPVMMAGKAVPTVDFDGISAPLSTAGKVNIGQPLTDLRATVKREQSAPEPAVAGQMQGRTSGGVVATAERELQRRMQRQEAGNEELEKGRKALATDDAAGAFAHFKNATEAMPEGTKAKEGRDAAARGLEEAAVKLAEAQITDGRPVAAVESLKGALKHNPESQAAQKLLANIEAPDIFNKKTTPGFRAKVEEVKQQATDGEKPQAEGRYDLAEKSAQEILSRDRYNKAANLRRQSVADEKDGFGDVAYNATRAPKLWEEAREEAESEGTVVANGGATALDKSGVGNMRFGGTASVNTVGALGVLPDAANPVPALNTPTTDAGLAVQHNDFFDTPSIAPDAQQWFGTVGGGAGAKGTAYPGVGGATRNVELNLGRVVAEKQDSLSDESLVPQNVEFEGFINYGSPIQTTSKDANGVETVNVITPSVISKRKVTTNAPQPDAAADGLAQLGDVQLASPTWDQAQAAATTGKPLAFTGVTTVPEVSTNSVFTAGGTRGTLRQINPADSLYRPRQLAESDAEHEYVDLNQPLMFPDPANPGKYIAHFPVVDPRAQPATSGNRSGKLAISANAIDALMFNDADSSAIAPDVSKELGEVMAEKVEPTVDILSSTLTATPAKPAPIVPAKKAAAKKPDAKESTLLETVDDFVLLDLQTLNPTPNAPAPKAKVAALTPPDINEVKAKLAKAQEKAIEQLAKSKPAPAPVVEELGKKVADPEPPAPPQKSEPPVPQPEVTTKGNAFSTFSLNVSDVSFKLAGAALEKGAMPDVASVRSEEFINALDYRDPEPAPGAPLAFASERARYPFAHNRDLLRLSVKTAAEGRQAGRPLNLVLLLDNSGSMERADRVRILQESLTVLAKQLQPQDKLSIITFSRTPRLWADGVAGNKASEFTDRVAEIRPEGGTDLGAAMDLGYTTALKHYQVGSVNRVVLLTDGAANLGNVDAASLKGKVETHRKQGVAFDCFGVGWEGYNDDLLEQLSRNGDGRYGFINTPEAAATEFAGALAGALRVAASDVKVQVEFNPKRVTSYRQLGYAKHQLKKEQFRDNTVDAAEIGAAEAGNALYTLELDPRGQGDIATVRIRFKVPGTTDYNEHEWTVPFTAPAPAMEQASSSLRLAATAGAFAEMLGQSPFAAEVNTDKLLGMINGIPAIYGADPRPGKLEWMIRQAKSVSGR